MTSEALVSKHLLVIFEGLLELIQSLFLYLLDPLKGFQLKFNAAGFKKALYAIAFEFPAYCSCVVYDFSVELGILYLEALVFGQPELLHLLYCFWTY